MYEWETNIYYHPEKSGLTIEAEEDIAGSYEFDIGIILRHEDGRYFYAQDSGCSCPSPFEDIKFEDLVAIPRDEAYTLLAQHVERGMSRW